MAKQKYIINGITYNGIEEMPEELQATFRQAAPAPAPVERETAGEAPVETYRAADEEADETPAPMVSEDDDFFRPSRRESDSGDSSDSSDSGDTGDRSDRIDRGDRGGRDRSRRREGRGGRDGRDGRGRRDEQGGDDRRRRRDGGQKNRDRKGGKERKSREDRGWSRGPARLMIDDAMPVDMPDTGPSIDAGALVRNLGAGVLLVAVIISIILVTRMMMS